MINPVFVYFAAEKKLCRIQLLITKKYVFMKTKFLRLSAVAIVVVALLSIGFFSACTNEDDFNSNSSSTTFNKKNAIQGDENRPYPEYEMKDFSDSETKS